MLQGTDKAFTCTTAVTVLFILECVANTIYDLHVIVITPAYSISEPEDKQGHRQ